MYIGQQIILAIVITGWFLCTSAHTTLQSEPTLHATDTITSNDQHAVHTTITINPRIKHSSSIDILLHCHTGESWLIIAWGFLGKYFAYLSANAVF